MLTRQIHDCALQTESSSRFYAKVSYVAEAPLRNIDYAIIAFRIGRVLFLLLGLGCLVVQALKIKNEVFFFKS